MAKILSIIFIFITFLASAQTKRARDFGLEIGVVPTGLNNSITDVDGVLVGHTTLIKGEAVRTGVTSILPHDGNLFQEKVPAAIFLGNAFGKLMGYTQVEELGNIETPIILTNTLAVPTAANALIRYTLNQSGNEEVRSVNPIVGETNDGFLNDIRAMSIKEEDVFNAIADAKEGAVTEGNVGAGTGTRCFGYKGGIGTSSRKLPPELGGHTVGVLVQTNFGGVLSINGIPFDKELDRYPYKGELNNRSDGSCMIVVATDAPIDARNLKRLAKRAFLGLGRTGGIASNGSGDYIIAFSTDDLLKVPYQSDKKYQEVPLMRNDALTPLFLAAIEATEEAIINSLIAAETLKGFKGRELQELPKEILIELIEKYKQ